MNGREAVVQSSGYALVVLSETSEVLKATMKLVGNLKKCLEATGKVTQLTNNPTQKCMRKHRSIKDAEIRVEEAVLWMSPRNFLRSFREGLDLRGCLKRILKETIAALKHNVFFMIAFGMLMARRGVIVFPNSSLTPDHLSTLYACN